MDNHCVMCGAYLADTGRMVCEKCEKPKTELKPCPFCGGEAILKHYATKELFRKQLRHSYVQCCICNIRTELAYTDTEVIIKWDRRAEDGK